MPIFDFHSCTLDSSTIETGAMFQVRFCQVLERTQINLEQRMGKRPKKSGYIIFPSTVYCRMYSKSQNSKFSLKFIFFRYFSASENMSFMVLYFFWKFWLVISYFKYQKRNTICDCAIGSKDETKFNLEYAHKLLKYY